MIKFESNFSFENWKDSVVNIGANSKKTICTFGIDFLDEALVITPDTFLCIGAGTGVGKTHMALTIARENAKCGRKVVGTFLEAGLNEMEDRARFEVLAKCFFADKSHGTLRDIRLNQYLAGRLDDLVEKYQKEIQESIARESSNLTIVKRKQRFTVDDLLMVIDRSIAMNADLLIVDHIHHFDYDSDEETRALTEIVGVCERTTQVKQLPIVLFAQFRKDAGGKSKKFKDISDFHGTASLTRTPTEVVIVTGGESMGNGTYQTFMHIPKSRYGQCVGSAASMCFSMKKQNYLPQYTYGKIKADKFDFDAAIKIPFWAKSHKAWI